MYLIRSAKLLILSLLLAAVVLPVPVLAATNPFEHVPCNDSRVRDSAVCETDETLAPNEVLIDAANILALVASAAAVIIIVLAGIRFITAAGDPGQVSQAKKAVLFSVIGLIVIAAARAIVVLVISRL